MTKAVDRRDELAAALRPLVVAPERLIADVASALNMPPACPGLFVIAENLIAMRQPLRTFTSAPSACDEVQTFAQAVVALPGTHALRRTGSLGARDEGSRGWGPFRDFLQRYALWCALWYRAHSLDPCDVEAYRNLQAAFAGIYMRLEPGAIAKRVQWLYEAGLLVRELRLASMHDLMRRLGLAAVDPPSLRDALVAQRREDDNDLPPRLWDRLGVFCCLIEDAFGLEQQMRRGGGGGRRRTRPARPHWAEADEEPDYTHYWYRVRGTEYAWGHAGYTVVGMLPAGEDAEQIRTAGGDPSEYGVGEDIEVDWRELDDVDASDSSGESLPPRRERSVAFPQHLPPLSTLYARARACRRRQAMDVQRFPIDIRRVRRAHIAAIIQTLSDVYAETVRERNEASRPHKSLEQRQSVIELAAVALVTGTPIGEAGHFIFAGSPDALPNDFTLAYSARHGCWIRPAPDVDRRTSAAIATPDPQAMRTRIVLPDVWGVGRCLRNATTDVVTATAQKVWNVQVRPRLLDARVPTKWTSLQSISSVLPSHFRGLHEGDDLTVALMYGQNDPLVSTQQFYTAHERTALAQRYHDEMIGLWKVVQPSLPHDDQPLFALVPRTLNVDGWTGDDLAPSPERVRPLIETSAQRVQAAAGETPYERHNRLALYTALGLAIATGFRAVRTPIADLAAIHRESATLCLQEKDRADGSHARLVVLPEAVLEQVEIYLRHARAIYAQLPLSHPTTLELRATKHRDRRRTEPETGRFTIDLRRTLYFWERKGRKWAAVELTGERLRAHCHAIADPACWPVANAGRHLLRTELERQRCPATLANAALGHWSQGEEPWVAASAMDPLLYRETIRPYLEGLLRRVGYQPVTPPWL